MLTICFCSPHRWPYRLRVTVFALYLLAMLALPRAALAAPRTQAAPEPVTLPVIVPQQTQPELDLS